MLIVPKLSFSLLKSALTAVFVLIWPRIRCFCGCSNSQPTPNSYVSCREQHFWWGWWAGSGSSGLSQPFLLTCACPPSVASKCPPLLYSVPANCPTLQPLNSYLGDHTRLFRHTSTNLAARACLSGCVPGGWSNGFQRPSTLTPPHPTDDR